MDKEEDPVIHTQCGAAKQQETDAESKKEKDRVEECSKSLSDPEILWRKERGIFMCCR